MTSTQPPSDGRQADTGTPTAASTSEPTRSAGSVPSIPLSPDPAAGHDEASLGGLVREATTHMSTLFRSELELARAEVTEEVRKAVRGSIFLVAALIVLFFSVFFLFLAAAQAVELVLPDWAAYLVTFGFMALLAGLVALVGFLRVRTVSKPERTIRTARDSAQTLSRRGAGHATS